MKALVFPDPERWALEIGLSGFLLLSGWASVHGAPTGEPIYLEHCAACHGVKGDGAGPAAVWLFPKPRDFSAGLFKIQSTPAGSLPTDEDLFQTITRGMPGSSMPSFTYLGEAARRDVVQYVKSLAGLMEGGRRVDRFEEADKAGTRTAVVVPSETPAAIEALTLGKELYTRLACNSCHGETGVGDGTAAAALKDNWGLPLRPRDFTIGSFRGGSTSRDLYLRIHNGLAGTPMPPFGEGVITADERWALVHYVQSLRRKDSEVHDILTPEDTTIRAARVEALPGDPLDRTWEKYDSVRVPLNPLWPEPYPIPAVAVTVLHDGKRVAVLCQWRDAALSGAAVKVQDFQDAIALQFSLKGTTPFLGMGDPQNPVNLWFWRAGWQAEVEGQRPDVDTQYPSMHVDRYAETNLLHLTAQAAGNVISQPHVSPVEDANARGFGTLKSQPLAGQNVRGRGVWNDGFWNVVLVRDLASPDEGDIQFATGRSVPVAFAVWNGGQRDRNGRKVISNWYQLLLEP